MAGDIIASLLIKLGLDARDVETGVKQAKGAFSGIGTGAKVAFGVAAGAAAVGFGLMAKGAAEMETAQGRFQAATGGSREEAIAFSRDMNGLVGSAATVGASFEAIAAAGINVAQQMGVTGDAGKALTEDFLAFAKVTGQDASEAVTGFDDILDSWGLTGADAAGIMDKLIVSWQKFGVSVEDSQTTLAALAPAMKAANLEIDDGIALLNLFGTKGIDANTASAAFAKSLTKVSSPEELQRLIVDISETEDAFERSQKAADLFGARAGAKLANALAGADLDDFKIGIDEATGATEEASEALVTTSDRFRMFFDQIGGGLRGVGAEFGPFLSGIGGLAMALGPLGARLGGTLGAGIVASLTASMAAPTILGKFQALGSLAGGTFGKAFGLAAAVSAIAIFGPEMMAMWDKVHGQVTRIEKDTDAISEGAFSLQEMQAELANTDAAIAKIRKQTVLFPDTIFGGGLAIAPDATGLTALEEYRKELLGQIDLIRSGVRAAAADPAARGAWDALFRGQLDALEQGQRDMATAVPDDPMWATLLGAGPGLVRGLQTFGTTGAEAADDAFDDITDSIRGGFGSVKDALRNPRQAVAPEKRLENMRGRLGKIAKELNHAVEVGDPWAISYWESAQDKQRRTMDGLASHTGRKSREAADSAIAQGKRTERVLGGLDLFDQGKGLMDSWYAGIQAGTAAGGVPAVPLLRMPVAVAGGRASGGGGLTVNFYGPIYGGAAGIRELGREIARQVRLQSRDR